MTAGASPAPSRPPRRRRRWRIFTVGLLAGFAFALLLLSLPAVQRRLLQRLVALQPGWRLELQSFSAGPSGVDADGLAFAMPGLEAHSEPVLLRLAPGELLLRRELRIERVEAHRLRVVITPAQFASEPASIFAGLLPLLEFPLPWSLGHAEFDGDIVVRDAGASQIVGTFHLVGGDAPADHTAKFRYELALNSALLPPGADHRVHVRGTLLLTQATDQRPARLDLTGDLELPRYGPLALPTARYSLAIAATPSGETYRAQLAFNPGASLDLNARLDRPAATLNARLDLHADQAIAASLLAAPAPTAHLALGADVRCDLRSGDTEARLSGQLAARQWSALRPELAVVAPLHDALSATVIKRAGRWRLEHFSSALQAEGSLLTLAATLRQPVGLGALPTGELATLTLDRAPLAWANPWLARAGLQLSPAEFSGAWTLARTADGLWTFNATRPAATTPVTLQGAHVPLIPPARFEFTPQLTLTRSRATLALGDFTIISDNRDKIAARITADYDLPSHQLHTAGRIRGSLPTLLSDGGHALPFSLVTQWDLMLAGAQLQAKSFSFAARQRSLPEPFLSLDLLQPLTVDLAQLTAVNAGAGDWLRLKFNGLQLGWISRWLPGRTVTGTIAAGESVLRSAADGALTLETAEPWRVADASFAIGGRTFFTGELGLQPGFGFHADEITAHLADLVARDSAGNGATGDIRFTATLHDRRGSAVVALDADLPALPHSADTFGQLRARLRLKAHNESTSLAVVDEFDLRIRNADRRLLSLQARQPFLFGLSRTGLFTAATTAPLRLSTTEIPLPWLQPWFTGTELRGTLQPGEFTLTAELTRFFLRPLKPLHVTEAFVSLGGRVLAQDAEISFLPGLDLTAICLPLPTFQLGYSGAVHVTNAAVEVAGRHALDLDLALAFVGDDHRALPNRLDLTTRLDFAVLNLLPALAGRGLPARGNLVARVNGDLLGRDPVDLWARLSGVPAVGELRVLPDFEISGRGRVDPTGKIAAGLSVHFATLPRATDARFGGRFNLHEADLEISSGFKSEFLDANELLALARAFQPTAVSVVRSHPSAAAAPRVAAALAQPFWSPLRGRFTLDLGRVKFAPYQIDGLHGRLELHDRELSLQDLRGEMFAGRWSGGVNITYDPALAAAPHALTGTFQIEQFDSARVVQTAFPNQTASLDARINVHSAFRSRGLTVFDLLDHAAGEFTIDGTQGLVRLTVPKQDMLATAAVFGGTVLLSPELRAVGRLLKQFAALPIDRLHLAGERRADGTVELSALRVNSPQVHLLAHGAIAAATDTPLMQRPLQLSVDLAAKDDLAVLLGGMSLLEKKPGPDGYRALKQTFTLGGKAGSPDTRPLYDLLAQAVTGSKGTWGFLMRKVQSEVAPAQAAAPPKTASLSP